MIPGFGESASTRKYFPIRNFFDSKDITPIPVPIPWKYRTMTNYVSQFLAFVRKHPHQDFYVWGFSFGAMVSYITQVVYAPDGIRTHDLQFRKLSLYPA